MFSICLCAFLSLCLCGCEPAQLNPAPLTDIPSERIAAFAPAKINIIPLTEFVLTEQEQLQLKVYVDLLDAFDSNIKAPVVFRFELYEYVPRSTQPKGRRISAWPDVDLTELQTNNRHWRDFLRSYEFVLNLDFQPEVNTKFVIQAGCLSPAGKRLTADFIVEYK